MSKILALEINMYMQKSKKVECLVTIEEVDSKKHTIYNPFADGKMEIERKGSRLVFTIGKGSIEFNSGCIRRIMGILQDENLKVISEEMK